MKDETLLPEDDGRLRLGNLGVPAIVQRGLTDGMRAPPSSPVIQGNL
jgi:hypothetical protein